MTITVVVADDERLARRRVVRLLEETGEVTVVAECAGGRDAVAAIREHRPQLAFLDVQMPDLDGFGVLAALQANEMPAVVFVTAFDQYALHAFEVHAVDYLLKPYDTARFRQAFARARARLGERERAGDDARLRQMLRDVVADQTPGGEDRLLHDRVAVKIDGSIRVLRTTDVDYWESAGNYVRAHVGANAHLIRLTFAKLESQLDPRRFVRIHRRFVVNLDRIVEIQPWFAGDAVVVLQNGTKLRLSRSFRARLHDHFLGAKSDDSEGPTV
jgi:two-component system LytT family response regulator